MEIEDVFLDDDDDEEEDMEVDEQNDANEEDFRNEGTKDEECVEAVCHITVESKKLMTSCQTGDFEEEDTATNHLSEAENMPKEEEMEIEDVFLDDQEEDMEVDE
ncbi:hypothetical protein HOLleu_27604 [Holothuria leucospilota]|uniref:Uncharacterized protein n=1 Tax=Holothuria leucospilota TaxID=206669 RepID=A0A9Q1BQT8_HOLLE|nr:hypothetical protein HOLleu_27604 [Holothuria leucospilota]